MKIPLVLPNLKFNQRNYFDCYESSFGGMLAYYNNDYDFILSLYCIPDAVSLYINQDTSEIMLNSRSLDINNFAISNLGFTIYGSSVIDKFSLRNKERPFVICFDEFYVKENNHYKKKHFSHASVGIGIIDPLHIKVQDPELRIPLSLQSYCERIISFDNDILDKPDAIIFYLLEKKNNFSLLKFDELFKSISLNNIKIWNNSIFTGDQLSVFFGLDALILFEKGLKDFQGINLAAQEFYKWIFPLYWKKHYIQKFDDSLSNETAKLLTIIIEEMEIFETNLLRLITNYKESLHFISIERWGKIISEIKKYIRVEEVRVHEKYL